MWKKWKNDSLGYDGAKQPFILMTNFLGKKQMENKLKGQNT